LSCNFFATAIAEPTPVATPATEPIKAQATESANQPEPVLKLKAGQPLVAGMQTEDIVATYDVALARAQVAAYPESPEASFVLAVALTRTSMVEEALQQVRKARRLAEKQGGPAYFDHMISQYEDMLKSYPKDNQVRYGLVSSIAQTPDAKTPNPKTKDAQARAQNTSANPDTISVISKQTPAALSGLPPSVVPQVKSYYQAALHNLDELLVQEPSDMWARAYRAYLQGEYSGDLKNSMDVWQACLKMAPANPAAYFFLGQGYLRQGNFKECLQNISKAVALREMPLQ
jgi:TolA-binding protein